MGGRPPAAGPDDPLERDLRIAMLWKVQPSAMRAVLAWLADGTLPFPWTAGDLERAAGSVPEGLREELRGLPSLAEARALRLQMERLGIRFHRPGEAGYPARVRRIADPPPYLFSRGDPFGAPAAPRVGIIGARAASEAGREIAYGLARDLALSGCVVVSGLARGIDGAAHRGAIEAGGRSVAVLGTGADLCYPPEHAALFRQMIERGGLVTEFPPGAPVRPLHFPRRNRILAALCDLLVVVEGTERSGARSTVDFALDQGIDVLAVPRDILHPGSALPNRLLREGAAPVTAAADLLQALPRRATVAPRPGPGSEPRAEGPSGGEERTGDSSARASGPREASLESDLLALLARGARDLDGCLRALPSAHAAELQSLLARLEILGQVTRLPGGRWRRAG